MKENQIIPFGNFVIALFFVMISGSVYTQTATAPVLDSVTKEFKTIKISEISIKSGEIFTEIQRVKESLLGDEEITLIKLKNDSLISYIDSLLRIDRALDLKPRNTRYLSNKLVYWKKFIGILDKEKEALAYEVRVLNDYKKNYTDDILVWQNTRSIIEEKESESSILERVDQLLKALDSLTIILQKKSDALLISLNSTTEESVLLDDHIDKIDQSYINKKNEIFVQNQPSVFRIDFKDSSNRNFKEPVQFFYQTEFKEVQYFLSHKIPNVIFQLLLLIILILAFVALKKRINQTEINKDSFYRKILLKIMSRSISAALIIGIFTSSLIFSERPELLKDLLVLFVTIPLILITRTFINRRFFNYLYLFGILVLLNLTYFIFPPDNIFYLLILFTISVIEIILLWRLTRYFYINPVSKHFLNNLILLLLVVQMGFALFGLLGLIYGSTTFAELAINVPIVSAFSGLLVLSTVIIINGFVSIGIDSSYAGRLNIFRFHGNSIKKRIIFLVNAGFIIFWLLSIMSLINIRRPFLHAITEVLTDEIVVGSASFSPGDIIMFFFVIWMAIVVSRMIRILLEQDILNKLNLAKGVPHTIAVMVRYSLVAIGVLLAVSAVGMPLDSLTVLAGAFGVGIGFGLQNIFNNIVSGFILLFERPIQIGDTIEVGQLIGKVESIGIRSSNVRTFEGADVIVPNGQLISNEVVNWTLSDQRRRIEVFAGVAYGSDPHKVEELFNKVLKNHPDILDDPAPSVFFHGLGDSSLDFRLLFWTSNYPEWIRIRSDIVFGVHDILDEEGISIPFPQMDLHLRSVEKGVDLLK
jgi:potassium-dependent mechanosensitive channel